MSKKDIPFDGTELFEDMEIVGPGEMLSQAREKLGLSQQDIATKLNFRLALVKNIEADIFDANLPETYNRGYLCSYAKLVAIDSKDILNSYETLSIAKIQCAQMQSFSKSTQKEAQNSLLTWISYLIVAILIGSTVMWWLQDVKSSEQTSNQPATQTTDSSLGEASTLDSTLVADNTEAVVAETVEIDENTPVASLSESSEDNVSNQASYNLDETADELTAVVENTTTEQNELAEVPEISTAIFTFAGDCWVSIYDATGERIAYGVKKPGYVMTITGQAPFKVDVGRPALTSIEFNGETIDMSQFDKDNIAKFTLPIVVE